MPGLALHSGNRARRCCVVLWCGIDDCRQCRTENGERTPDRLLIVVHRLACCFRHAAQRQPREETSSAFEGRCHQVRASFQSICVLASSCLIAHLSSPVTVPTAAICAGPTRPCPARTQTSSVLATGSPKACRRPRPTVPARPRLRTISSLCWRSTSCTVRDRAF